MENKELNDAINNFQKAAPEFLKAFQGLSSHLNSSLKSVNKEEANKYYQEIKDAPKQIQDKLDELKITVNSFNDSISKL